jgi:hypothetical protein
MTTLTSPRLRPGALLVADNADQCPEYLARVLTDVPYFAATLHKQEQRLLDTSTGTN